MLLSAALLVLFMTGIWLYCLTDAIITPVGEFRGLSKPAWVAVIAVTFLAGALAWLVAGPLRTPHRTLALAQHRARDGFDEDGYLASSRWTRTRTTPSPVTRRAGRWRATRC